MKQSTGNVGTRVGDTSVYKRHVMSAMSATEKDCFERLNKYPVQVISIELWKNKNRYIEK